MTGPEIILEEYKPYWDSQFNLLKKVYLKHLTPLIEEVQHVGSTSVPGLIAKPILDIDLIVHPAQDIKKVIEKLSMLGYDHLGDLGIVKREAFRRRDTKVPYDDMETIWAKHHLYVCPRDSISLKNHLTLRDYLRNNPAKVQEYGELKKHLLKEHSRNIEAYIEGKTSFITAILQEAGFDAAVLAEITNQNKSGD